MSFAIDLKEYGTDLKKEYESVISSDPETTWTVFDYVGSDNVLTPGASGPGDLDDFVDAFDDAKVQYGLARVEFNSINKIVLVGWVGENVPSRQRLVFNAHMSAVAKQFAGHHVQITARSSDELTPKVITERVASAAGSKYSAAAKPPPSTKPAYVTAKEGARDDDWGSAQSVEERELDAGNGNGYKSNVRRELEELRKGKKAPSAREPAKKTPARVKEPEPEPEPEPESEEEEAEEEEQEEEEEEKPAKKSGISGLDSGTSYKPVGKIDIKAIREAGKNSKFADARIEKIESSYKPVGKVDLKAIREQARKEKELKARKDDSGPAPRARAASPAASPDASPAASPARQRSSQRETQRETKREKVFNEPESKDDIAQARKAEYGVSRGAAPRRKAAAAEDDDEPQYGSLADRMKAFQASIGAAKPKFDAAGRPTSGGRSSTRTPSVASSRSEPKAAPKFAKDTEDEDGDEDEDDAPISVAAQLAKARISGQKKEDSPPPPARTERKAPAPKDQDDEDDAPKANVSTFAARFAAKAEPKDEPKAEPKSAPKSAAKAAPEPEEDEEDVPPPAPRRANGGSAKAEPEPAPKAAKESSAGGLTGIVQFEHEKEDDDEISLTVGEKITEIQEVDENWYLGRNSAGDVGLFPAEFVEISGAGKSAGVKADAPKQAPPSAAAAVKVAVAQYSYEAGDDDELEFEENEEITEIEFASEDWWSGKNSKGAFGLFPASYVTLK